METENASDEEPKMKKLRLLALFLLRRSEFHSRKVSTCKGTRGRRLRAATVVGGCATVAAFAALVALAAPLVAILWSSSASAQEHGQQKIRVLTLLGRPMQVTVAEERGIFARNGVAAETENLPNSDALRSSLATGKGDLGYLAVDNAVAMVELAHEDVTIVMGGEGSQNKLIAQPDIKSVNDLRGK